MTREQLRNHKAGHNKHNSWWLNDVRGIPLSRVCFTCVREVKKGYKPEVVGEGNGRYEDAVEERIEPEDA